jgi:hypothetical protein
MNITSRYRTYKPFKYKSEELEKKLKIKKVNKIKATGTYRFNTQSHVPMHYFSLKEKKKTSDLMEDGYPDSS